jgi:hypothetical protein
MMYGEDAPDADQAKTLPLFGKRLRGYFGDAILGMDDEMLGLLEQLLEIPGIDEMATATRDRQVKLEAFR